MFFEILSFNIKYVWMVHTYLILSIGTHELNTAKLDLENCIWCIRLQSFIFNDFQFLNVLCRTHLRALFGQFSEFWPIFQPNNVLSNLIPFSYFKTVNAPRPCFVFAQNGWQQDSDKLGCCSGEPIISSNAWKYFKR